MVLAKAKRISSRFIPGRKTPNINTADLEAARKYIHDYWPKLTRTHPKDDDSLIGLPKPYLVPAFEEGHEFDFNELYYWDSFFNIQGLLDEEHKKLVLGILDNLFYLFERYKIIPNASRTFLTGRSQPPFLSSFIRNVYEKYNMDKKWLAKAMKIAKEEYHIVWMGMSKPNARQVYDGLSRYYDINYHNDLAEAESGWDMTSRFGRKCLNYLPVDLNALLFKYEMDFSWADEILGNHKSSEDWEDQARHRKRTMNKLMWSELKGIYFDYNYVKEKRGSVSSLATYFPMWAGMVDEHQATRLVDSLRRFEEKGGLATTDPNAIGQLVPGEMPVQWAYPNGWAPLHYIVVGGLSRYGYHDDARRIALKWLNTNLQWFKKNGVFLEKYNVVHLEKPPAKGVYPSQTGFGWTNAVFERFCKDFIDNDIPH